MIVIEIASEPRLDADHPTNGVPIPRLSTNGLLVRRVVTLSPVAVEYETTPLGRSLQPPFKALYAWTLVHFDEVEAARRTFDDTAHGTGTRAVPAAT